ncbi:MAG: deoxyribonuclease IV [Phycisphaeraceae bacterium]|nr:deoxyribonuclease IV [Phycisphaeraceae bacterium]
MFGSHLSIAGGMTNALHEAERLGLECVQVFTKNQQQWKAPPLDGAQVADWTAEVARLGWQARTVSHASYLINLASPNADLHAKSVDLMHVEIERCEALGIPFLVHHPGAATDGDPDAGLARIARAYRELFRRTRGYRTVSCLENTVGSGTNLGRTFEELARLRSMILGEGADPERVAFCFDTCHAHAGGYDLSEREGAARVLDDFDSICGEDLMRVVHLNDSKGAVGSRLDRHAHVGEGTIGGSTRADRLARSGFAAVVNRPSLRGVPKILETPKGNSPKGTPHDTINLRRLRRLQES